MPDGREQEGWYAAEADFLSEERNLRAAAGSALFAEALRRACAGTPEAKVSPGDTASSMAVTALS